MISEETILDPCPLCDGKAEILDVYRHLTVKPSCNKYEIVCSQCGLTLKCDRSTRKSIKKWNNRPQVKRLKETLYYELPEKYPDNCQICYGSNCGVRGNENIIDEVVMCDYCSVNRKKE